MIPGLVDSHAHLGEEAFDGDRDEVLARAGAAGVEAVVVIGYDASSSRRVATLVAPDTPGSPNVRDSPEAPDSPDVPRRRKEHATRPGLWGTAGIAPHHVREADEAALEVVEELLEEPGVGAVGEIGLDYHYDIPREAQRKLFARQLETALDRDLPVVVHSREAEDDVVELIREVGGGQLRGVIHCFTESAAMADAVLELGLFVSFAGIVTFQSAAGLRETAAGVPLERTLIETDSPFLAPVPYRGKRNEPAFVEEVARSLARVHGADPAEVAAMTAANARELFGLPAPD